MSDMNVRSDAVDVEQIMRQIRARIREKRGADYTEAELQQLATVKLEKFLDPRGVRSDLVEQYRRQRVVAPAPPNYEFGESTLFETHRGVLRSLRRLFRPVLKLLFNPDRITSALHIQAQVNSQAEQRLRRLEEREPLSYELLHNLTLEITRLGIEVHNLKMRVESLSSRLDFDERRGRALESVVEYRPSQSQRPASQSAPRQQGGQNQRREPPAPASQMPTAAPAAPVSAAAGDAASAPAPSAPVPPAVVGGNAEGSQSPNGERRRRRRRRRRRPGSTLAETQGAGSSREGGATEAGPADAAEGPGDDFDDSPDASDANDQ